MKRFFSLLLIGALASAHVCASTRYVGGDISTLPLYEQHNSYYKDASNKKINNLLSWFITDCGWNTFRVRIFVTPTMKDQDGSANPSVCQDLAYVTALGKRIKDAGGYFMLDFHYSDTWVDATHIQAPAVWKGLSNELMADSLANYTHRVLQTLKAAGATPDLVQVGNEIMYGLCDIKVSPYDDPQRNANWPAFINLLKAGCNAVREECPNAQIIIHTDHPENATNTKYYYNKLVNNNVDFDVIGLSYYPFWHGYMNTLVATINNLKTTFPTKRVQIVECAYNFQYWPSSGVKYDTRSTWPCSVQGQYNFVKDLVDNLKPLENVDGISYWFPEEAGNGDDTNWSTSNGTVIAAWLNRGFWDENKSTSGHAINRTAAPTQEHPAADVCAPYYMRNFYNEEQAIEQTVQQPLKAPRKILRDGQILIERPDGSLVSLDGSRQR